MVDYNDIWDEALQEAYASAPINEVILHTLELRNTSFVDDEDNPIAIRVVMAYGEETVIGGEEIDGYYLTLEDDAPAEAGAEVFFTGCMFGLSLPEQSQNGLPSIEITLDNVSQQISKHLEGAVGVVAPIYITYREYLLTNKTAPAFIINGLSMKRVKINGSKAVGTAQFNDLMNKSFPKKLYRPSEFRGLAQ